MVPGSVAAAPSVVTPSAFRVWTIRCSMPSSCASSVARAIVPVRYPLIPSSTVIATEAYVGASSEVLVDEREGYARILSSRERHRDRPAREPWDLSVHLATDALTDGGTKVGPT